MAVALAILSVLFVLAVFFTIGYLWWQLGRPLTETDEWCSRVDVDLDERRAEGSVRRWTGSGWRA